MTADDDLAGFRLPPAATPPRKPAPPRHRGGEPFLKGPVPWAWLARAAALPGRALHVGLALWFRAGLGRRATVALGLAGLERELGVRRDAARRGLRALEGAGLVRVERHPGGKPRVTLLDAPPSPRDRPAAAGP